MRFQSIPTLPDILNSEGPILSIVKESNNKAGKSNNLYIRGRLKDATGALFTSYNREAMEAYLLGKISLEELFKQSETNGYIEQINIEKKHLYIKHINDDTLVELYEYDKTYDAFTNNMKPAEPLGILHMLDAMIAE